MRLRKLPEVDVLLMLLREGAPHPSSKLPA